MPANYFKTFLSLCASTVQSMYVCVRISSHVKIRRLVFKIQYGILATQFCRMTAEYDHIMFSTRRVLVS